MHCSHLGGPQVDLIGQGIIIQYTDAVKKTWIFFPQKVCKQSSIENNQYCLWQGSGKVNSGLVTQKTWNRSGTNPSKTQLFQSKSKIKN